MKGLLLVLSFLLLTFSVKSQDYQKKKPVNAKTQLINHDKEPKLKGANFVSLFDGKTLDGWSTKQGTMVFEVKDGEIVGRCSEGPSTFLCTDKEYVDFIFTCEVKWEVDGNTGVQIRSRIRKDPNKNTVIGPQVEMEDLAKNGRGWSGGIYGQNCGGWFYPLRAPEHKALKSAIDRSGWNRITVMVEGNVVKTWINGLPAAHWVDEKNQFPKGFIALQVHGGKQGIIHWRNLKIREL
ncbi:MULTISPECIES: 3-keto-disaccharide hydrolase [unclassified Saccharicrinis]|uniref:3-keto-disaccharide hydrolase n=1 Tax=unclassified Saccharicrinis TaxID=2646859 RepID=UPI003D334371